MMVEAECQRDGGGSPLFLSPVTSDNQDCSLRLPKNKSTGNLLSRPEGVPDVGRIRFSFDASAMQEMNERAR
jgi:hypothetical protein